MAVAVLFLSFYLLYNGIAMCTITKLLQILQSVYYLLNEREVFTVLL